MDAISVNSQIERLRWQLLFTITQCYPGKIDLLINHIRNVPCRVGVTISVWTLLVSKELEMVGLKNQLGISATLFPEHTALLFAFLKSIHLDNYEWAVKNVIDLIAWDYRCKVQGLGDTDAEFMTSYRVLEFRNGEHPSLDHSVPRRPDIWGWQASVHSWDTYEKSILGALRKYKKDVEEWHKNAGFTLQNKKSQEDLHFIWLTWRIVENLSWRAIANRQAEYGYGRQGYTAIKSAVDKLSARVGVHAGGVQLHTKVQTEPAFA